MTGFRMWDKGEVACQFRDYGSMIFRNCKRQRENFVTTGEATVPYESVLSGLAVRPF